MNSCNGRTVVPTTRSRSRRACGLFLWDLPSAILYKWCHHLLKNNIYEGRGGYKFVRFDSNSMLQLLYPCNRYHPRKCLLCGGTAADHLELWWSKQLYTPFDLYLDKTYFDALTSHDDNDDKDTTTIRGDNYRHLFRRKTNRNQTAGGADAATSITVTTEPPSFAFHKRYVEDVSDIVNNNVDHPRKKAKHIKRQVLKAMMTSSLLRSDDFSNYKITKIPVTTATNVYYIAPVLGQRRRKYDDDDDSDGDFNFIIDVLSKVAIMKVENLIFDQASEIEDQQRKSKRLLVV